MNNNRGNNRRRGRGNNRQQGGQQTNRIDSRARGNAPQLLEKYKKLAHDAHLNGDRVTEEYYLQFADHYFRVIADQKQRQEESRQPRRDDHRQPDYGDDFASDYDPYGEAPVERAPRPEREFRQEREPRSAPEPVADEAQAAPEQPAEVLGEGERSVYEPAENPFVRDSRASRGLKQRKPRRGPRDEDAGEDQAAASADAAAAEAPAGDFDAAALPPSISAKPGRKRAEKPVDASVDDAEGATAEEKPRRRRTRKPAADEPTPEAVNG
ncbi:DUF4167 domain-containing protein [Novosphingobium soli]|uniref:DUF4167 domain-containing protein n=1 Tax=Novosphingobium soli TaxID=574956 RepID=A0ABV6D1I5_9SPHN